MNTIKLYLIFFIFFGFIHIFASNAKDELRWPCADGSATIPMAWKCDGRVDCDDLSDEIAKNCPRMQCALNDFNCTSGGCIPSYLVCNGGADCEVAGNGDFSDEINCTSINKHPVCNEDDYRCENGLCIVSLLVCNGALDCESGSDEANCPELCESDQVMCNNSVSILCIEKSWVCDGASDCSDGEDEKKCGADGDNTTPSSTIDKTCGVERFLCSNNCIEVEKACDGSPDCLNGEDEDAALCSTACPSRSSPSVWQHKPDKTMCSQECRNTPAGLKCLCLPGYRLEPDGYRCRPIATDVPQLLYSANNKIINYSIYMAYADKSMIYSNYKQVDAELAAMDFDVSQKTLMWVERRKGSLGIMGIPGASGLAFDWIARNIYVVFQPYSTHSGVGVLNLNKALAFPQTEQLCKLDIDVTRPVGIAVHPSKRILLLVDQGIELIASRLLLSNMDGSNVTLLVAESARRMHSVTIDYVTNIAYWSESSDKEAKIEGIRLDNFERKILVSSHDHDITISKPLSLAVFMDTLYFCDATTRQVWRTDAVSGKPLDFVNYKPVALVNTVYVSKLLAIHISHPLIQRLDEKTNECTASNCSHACVLQPTGNVCLCPSNMQLSYDGQICIVRKPNNSNKISGCTKPPVDNDKAFVTPHLNSTFVSFLNVLNYSCREGYYIRGKTNTTDEVLTCLQSGKWNLNPPECVRYNCSTMHCGDGGKCVEKQNNRTHCLCSNGNITFVTCPRDTSSILPQSNSSKTAAILISVLLLLAIMVISMVIYLRKSNYALLRKMRATSPTYRADQGVATHQAESHIREEGVPNPTYDITCVSSRVVLPLPDTQVSEAARSTSVFSESSDFTYKSLQENVDYQLTQSSNPAPDKQKKGTSNTHLTMDIKKSMASAFKLKKSESQESIVDQISTQSVA